MILDRLTMEIKSEESVKMEADDNELNDFFLREWTETTDEKDTKWIKDKNKDIDIKEEENQSSSKNKVKELGKKTQSKMIDHLIEKLCQGAPISEKVLSLCKFKCPECAQLLNSWSAVERHHQKHHQKTKVKLVNVNDFLLKPVSHICKICSSYILCDSVFFKRHLRLHNISINQYVKMVGKEISKNVPHALYSNEKIGNLCVFQCDECNMKLRNTSTMIGHKKRNHGSKTDFKKCMIKRIYHKCNLCHRSITCDMNYLSDHFKRAHGISPKEYCKQTGCTLVFFGQHPNFKSILQTLPSSKKLERSCIFSCKKCQKGFIHFGSFKDHIKRHHKGKQYGLEESLKAGFSYQCESCPSIMLCDRFIISKHLSQMHNLKSNDVNFPLNTWRKQYDNFCKSFKESIAISSKVWETTAIVVGKIPKEEMSSVIGNLCTFKCPTCFSKHFSSWAKLNYHLKMIHSQSAKFCPSLVVEARYHSCLLCPKAVLSDRHILSCHLRQSHEIGLKKYEKTFLQNGGKALPVFNDWLYQLDMETLHMET